MFATGIQSDVTLISTIVFRRQVYPLNWNIRNVGNESIGESVLLIYNILFHLRTSFVFSAF